MIEIKFDKESELLWLKDVISAGVLNITRVNTLKYLGVDLTQNVKYVRSNNYVDDTKERRKVFDRRFGKSGFSLMAIEDILRKEASRKENKNGK